MLFTLRRRMTLLAATWISQLGMAQEPPPSPPAEPNAMKLYLRAWTELLKGLETTPEEFTRLPYDGWKEMREWRFEPSVWQPLLQQSMAAYELFVQASAMERCELNDPTPFDESVGDQSMFHVWQVAVLVGAHGWLEVRKRPEIAVDDALALLRSAAHLRQIENRRGFSFAYHHEQLGLYLLAGALDQLTIAPAHAKSVARAQRGLARFLETRPSRAGLRDLYLRSIALTLRQAPEPRPGDSQDRRDELSLMKRIRARSLAIVGEHLAPFAERDGLTVAEAKQRDREFLAKKEEAFAQRDDDLPADRLFELDALLWLMLPNDPSLQLLVAQEREFAKGVEGCRTRLRELREERR